MKNLVIDTDIGTDVDDLFALAYALKNPEINVRAISTVHGDTKIRAKIVRKLERIIRKNIPIMIGASGDSKYWCGFEHLALSESEGEESIYCSTNYQIPLKKPFVSKICPEDYTKNTRLACIGPLTNIKDQIESSNGISKVKKVYLMGEKITSHNFIVDALATGAVFSQEWEKYLITKEVSKKISFTKDELKKFKGTKLGDFIYDSALRWFDYYKDCNNTAVMYDVLAVSAAAGEGYVKFKKAKDTESIFVSYDVDLRLKDKIAEAIK